MLITELRRRILPTLLALAIAVTGTSSVTAQLGAPPEQGSQESIQPDVLGRDSPRGLVDGLLDALANDDLERASRLLDLSSIPEHQRAFRGPQLVRQLKTLLSSQGQFLPFAELSTAQSGSLTDNQEAGVDRIGVIKLTDRSVDILAQRGAPEGADAAIWRVSRETVEQLPGLALDADNAVIEGLLPNWAAEYVIFGAPIGHWIALFIIGIGAAALTIVPAIILVRHLENLPTDRHANWVALLIRALAKPLALMGTIAISMWVANSIGVSIVARSLAARLSEVLFWITMAWLLWRTIDGLSDLSIQRFSRHERSAGLSAVSLARRASKTLVVVIAVLAALATLGLDMTTGLAALGIGGLALALGAQKTIENFVGSITLVIDQPARVGDFCKFGETLGTVEDIGMRSTRIRTLARTLVTIPNGEFSSMTIENYTIRDRFLFQVKLGLRYDIAPETLQSVLMSLRELLASERRVYTDDARVRFIEFGDNGLIVEIFAYIAAKDWDHYLEIRESLNIGIATTVRERGADVAFSTRTVVIEAVGPQASRQQ